MLKSETLARDLLPIVLCAYALLLLHLRDRRHKKEEAASSEYPRKQADGDVALPAGNTPPKQPAGCQENHETRDPIVWATVFIAVATAASVAVAALQWLTLEKTDQTQRIANRPYIFEKNVFWTPDNHRFAWRNWITYENAGNTAPIDLTIRVACAYSERAQRDPLKIKQINISEKYARVAGPRQEFIGGACTFPVAQVGNTQSGFGHIYFYSRAEYRDVYEKSVVRVTEYCTEFVDIDGEVVGLKSNIPGFNATPCDTHNCTDEECRPGPP